MAREKFDMLRRVIRLEVSMLNEVRGSTDQLPKAASSIVSRLPGLRVRPTTNGWIGTARISEKRSKEMNTFERAWERMKSVLARSPWHVGSADHAGYNAQTDTGGNFSANSNTYVHESGITATLKRTVSFTTGTKEWTVIITDSRRV